MFGPVSAWVTAVVRPARSSFASARRCWACAPRRSSPCIRWSRWRAKRKVAGNVRQGAHRRADAKILRERRADGHAEHGLTSPTTTRAPGWRQRVLRGECDQSALLEKGHGAGSKIENDREFSEFLGQAQFRRCRGAGMIPRLGEVPEWSNGPDRNQVCA